MFKRISFTVFIAILFLSRSTVIAQQAPENTIPKSNEKIQIFLQSLISSDRGRMFTAQSEEELRDKLKELEEMTGGHRQLVVQLAYFVMRAKNMNEGSLPGFIIDQLKISKKDIAFALIPFLKTNNEQLLKKGVYRILPAADISKNKISRCDFSIYELVLTENKPNIPEGLVKYMLLRNADSALSVMAKVYLNKNEAEALIDEIKSKDKLGVWESLSNNPNWWVRLYTAEKLSRNWREDKGYKLTQKLKNDDNSLVRDALSKVKLPSKE